MAQDIDRKRAQFEFERQLRQRILDSPREHRAAVTTEAYGELFSEFGDHSALSLSEDDRRRVGRHSAGMIAPLIGKSCRILEVGCGCGDVLRELASRGHTCVGTEASALMVEIAGQSSEVTILHGLAGRLEFADGSFDVVFSQQVLEHLHPDDVPIHFEEAFRVLRPGGIMAVETPNKKAGPQDISRGFTRVAEGLHLKEWTLGELSAVFRTTGFTNVRGLLGPAFIARRSPLFHRIIRVPVVIKKIQDFFLGMVPGLRYRTLFGKMVGLEDVFLFGRKPTSYGASTRG